MISPFFDIHNNKDNKEVSYIKAKRLVQIDDGCLSCAVTALGYLSWKKRYISETMCLSKKEVRKLLKKEKEKIGGQL